MQKVGVYSDGRDLQYDAQGGRFYLAGQPVQTEHVIGWDQAGQVAWAGAETRQWFDALTSTTITVSDAQRPRGRVAKWVKIVVPLVVIAALASCCVLAAYSARSSSTGPNSKAQTPTATAALPSPLEVSGLSATQFANAEKALKASGVTNFRVERPSFRGKDGSVFLKVDSTDGNVAATYTLTFEGDQVDFISDDEPRTLYSHGKPQADYVFRSDIPSTQSLKPQVEAAVLSQLKAPRSAQFYDQMTVDRPLGGSSDGKPTFTVSGTVTAQNSYGAMLDSNFVVSFEVKRDQAHKVQLVIKNVAIDTKQ